jgi:hypothetical protein
MAGSGSAMRQGLAPPLTIICCDKKAALVAVGEIHTGDCQGDRPLGPLLFSVDVNMNSTILHATILHHHFAFVNRFQGKSFFCRDRVNHPLDLGEGGAEPSEEMFVEKIAVFLNSMGNVSRVKSKHTVNYSSGSYPRPLPPIRRHYFAEALASTVRVPLHRPVNRRARHTFGIIP